MADTGWITFSSFATVGSGGTEQWYSPSLAQSEDASESYFIGGIEISPGVYAVTLVSDRLTATSPSGINIPPSASIVGIEVRHKRRGTISGYSDRTIQLVKGGTAQGNNKAAQSWPTSIAFSSTYGGPADLWGLAWSPSDFGAGFGVAVAVNGPNVASSHTARVDVIEAKVYYESAGFFAVL